MGRRSEEKTSFSGIQIDKILNWLLVYLILMNLLEWSALGIIDDIVNRQETILRNLGKTKAAS